MKALFLWIALAASWGTAGETNFLVTTNYLLAPERFREVDGVLYDRSLSTNWGWLSGKFVFQGKICDDLVLKMVPYGFDDHPQMWSRGKRFYVHERDLIIIRHCPGPPISGSIMPSDLRVMHVGYTNFYEQLVSMFDCGTNHWIPFFTTNRIIRPMP